MEEAVGWRSDPGGMFGEYSNLFCFLRCVREREMGEACFERFVIWVSSSGARFAGSKF
jgi:hypothetical protein